MFEDVPRLDELGSVRGQSVLVRSDLNVPLLRSVAGPMVVADTFRVETALPTIQWLVSRGARVTVASHLGRPKGHPSPDLTMAPVRVLLQQLVPGVTVLENLRFHPGETENDPAFGAQLVKGHDLYVNDAFGACHRQHASIVFPPTVLPSAAGLLLASELDALGHLIEDPARPFTVAVGGVKVTDKLGTIRALARTADRILVGGAMAFTFLAAQGRSLGGSLVDASEIDACRALLQSGLRIELPSDLIASRGSADDGTPPDRADVGCFDGDLPAGWRAFDIGPDTRQRFCHQIAESAAVLWNGPMGVFEDSRFAAGTDELANAIASCAGFTVVGGGDTVAAVRALGLTDRFDHVSSGGGAMLELIEQGDLPGIEALRAGKRARPSATASSTDTA